ncbi:RagB/SusD family nutrient uptake outer membrane protein [Maribellus sp. CM-23]|uniref:RagB/SusD family nutrient uptake outer membrane protein n=1 Tax=Maribellus sp. CM-23 TaxID=2781026 RepID=UPI001F490178|nr:RagB/SusD family nutrient uptake outer membrane protein [Maribellus sp. CM-23]MCE4566980.1 RagB/SusD family nutrient uptake outer membrane protein [Maribellus sp. CM-23]
MKKILNIGLLILAIVTFSCSDDYLSRSPLDKISEADFWSSPNDLKIYVNQFYTMLPAFPGWGGGYLWDDNNSDNMHHSGYDSRLAGFNTINSGSGNWSFSRLRSINLMLDNYDKVEAPESQVNQFVGEAYFFRAYFYFNLIKNYGDVPWIEHTLNADSEELYAARAPRNEVVDNILSDLDDAISRLSLRAEVSGNRINKESALLLKSRVALYEGTWEKYHQGTDFGVAGSNGQNYLTAAATAAKQLIDLNSVSLYNTGNPGVDYGKLFNSDDLNSMNEVLLWRKYNVELGLAHNVQRYIPRSGGGTGLTKSLIDSYLCTDGNPIASSTLYQGDHSLENVIADRDPRLSQMIWIPDDAIEIVNGNVVASFEKPALAAGGEDRNTTGYQLKKGGDPTSPGIQAAGQGITALPIFRFAEALLNYAEAKAELGTITQADLDMSINKIRARAGMPNLMLNTITADPNWQFPALSPVLNEVRRERRVEFACEGYRFDDLARWRAHNLIVGKRPIGAWFDQTEFPDLVVGETILLDENGYIDYLKSVLPSGWGFDPSRDYLLAVPPNEITLNPNLGQNPGWE